MLSDPGSAGDLIIHKQVSRIHLLYQVIQDALQFFLAHRHHDPESRGTSEKPVYMLIDRKDMIIPARTGIIDSVSKP